MGYDPRAYWAIHPPFPNRPAHRAQEIVLLDEWSKISPKSILEVGVGQGRIAALALKLWPDASYIGIDISTDRLAEARAALGEWPRLVEADLLTYRPVRASDLVLAVEVLMHIPPSDLQAAVDNLRAWSRRDVYTVDWTEPATGPVADHNFIHDYAGLGFTPVATVGRQTIFHAEGSA